MRDAAVKLNQLTDQVNEAYRSAEDFLNTACSIGIEAAVQVREDEDFTWYLGYRRVNGKFRIAIVCEFQSEPDSGTAKAWSEAPREDKLDCVALLPALIEAVAKRAEERVAEVETAARTAISLFTKEGK